MNITRDVALDLWPLVEAGEASADSRAIVEEFSRRDPEFARVVEAGRRLAALGGAERHSLPADHEKRTLDRTKARIARRSWYLAGTIFFLLLPFSVAGSSEEGITWFMWRDRPVLAALSTLVGVVAGLLHRRTGDTIRVGRE